MAIALRDKEQPAVGHALLHRRWHRTLGRARLQDALELEAGDAVFVHLLHEGRPGPCRDGRRGARRYWQGRELREYLGGPFGDRSGGLISFETDSQDVAAQLVADDPFVREGVVECSWVKEWKVE